jgi:hypothetical protein
MRQMKKPASRLAFPSISILAIWGELSAKKGGIRD